MDISLKILIADDYDSMRHILSKTLEQIGFTQIDEALSPAEAMEKIRGNDYGLIISGWDMESEHGAAFLNQVQADAKVRRIPFIMITADSKPEHIDAAKKSGVAAYIVKPFNAETLKNKIETILEMA